MQEINESNYQSEVVQHSGLVVMDFWAPWCGPCRMLAPLLEKLSEEAKIVNAKIVKVNVDENPNLAAQYNVSSIPTLVFSKGGTEVDRTVGVLAESKLKQKIQDLK